MRQTKSTAIIYGMIHFLVDFCCAFFMFSVSERVENFYTGLLIYNFLAFAMQMPVGLLADRLKKNSRTAGAGCLLVFPALLLMKTKGFLGEQAGLWLGLTFAGFGNCLFHVGGGIEVMKGSKDSAGPLGIFVSFGAIGIFFGTMLGKQREPLQLILLCLLAVGAAGLLLNDKRIKIPADEGWVKAACFKDAENAVYMETGNMKNATCSAERHVPEQAERHGVSYIAMCALVCFFLVVVLRSYLGMIIHFPWKDSLTDSILMLGAVFCGKLAGGFMADKYGVKRTAVWTLFLATILFCFGNYMGAGILAVFLFNMSMPITLYLAAKVLSGQNGFAFGILTFAIFIGFLPAYAGYQTCSNGKLAGLTAISFILLGAGALLYERRQNE